MPPHLAPWLLKDKHCDTEQLPARIHPGVRAEIGAAGSSQPGALARESLGRCRCDVSKTHWEELDFLDNMSEHQLECRLSHK